MLISKQGAGAVEGSFASVRNPLLFMDASVNSTGGDGNDVTLNLTRNSRQAGSPASTDNQRAVAMGIDALPQTHEIWRAFMLSTDADSARQALSQLSGDMHAGVASALPRPAWRQRRRTAGRCAAICPRRWPRVRPRRRPV